MFEDLVGEVENGCPSPKKTLSLRSCPNPKFTETYYLSGDFWHIFSHPISATKISVTSPGQEEVPYIDSQHCKYCSDPKSTRYHCFGSPYMCFRFVICSLWRALHLEGYRIQCFVWRDLLFQVLLLMLLSLRTKKTWWFSHIPKITTWWMSCESVDICWIFG